VLAYLGRAYYETVNLSTGTNILENALANDQEDDVARLYLALVQLRSGDQNRGQREVESGLEGIQATLEDLAASPYRGIFWDPGRQIRSEIRRALGGKLEPAELVAAGEWIGSRLDEEVELARRDELQQRYFRGGDS